MEIKTNTGIAFSKVHYNIIFLAKLWKAIIKNFQSKEHYGTRNNTFLSIQLHKHFTFILISIFVLKDILIGNETLIQFCIVMYGM